VEIDGVTWMAQNLNYSDSNLVNICIDLPDCEKYGRYYDWDTVMEICPTGWHLPSNSEFDALKKHSIEELMDESGFAAQLGGRKENGFVNDGSTGYWWSADASSDLSAYMFFLNTNEKLSLPTNKTNLLSVRCVKDPQ